MVPLCEQCYFRRQNLLCHACDGALRGSYITALGKKYHVEHFTCSLCSTVFGNDDSYYEHQDNIFCRYHYSTMYASKCEGCKTAILKQFVEVFRGGREQQWHPECYMINKFWNVMINPHTPSAYPKEFQQTIEAGSSDERKQLASPDADAREAILQIEQETEQKSYHIWSTLCGYEEATAACISDMLQYATSCRYHETLLSTSKFVAKIEVLLSAIDILVVHIDPLLRALAENNENTEEVQDAESPEFKNLMSAVKSAGFTQLKKEPKTLCKKVVSFMSLLSKSRERSIKEPGPTQELLDSVTGMAHYLKLLIRYGLTNALRYDRAFPKANIIDEFLEQVGKHELIPENPLESLGVSGKANDRCLKCGNSTEDDCATLEDKRWHLNCLQCVRCQTSLGSDVKSARYLTKDKTIICQSCVKSDDEVQSDFTVVTKLHQFVYLVKIALARLQLVLKTYDSRDNIKPEQQQLLAPQRPSLKTTLSSSSIITSSRRPSENGERSDPGYMTTLKDIRKLRSTKYSQRLSESSKLAHRSHTLDLPPSEHGFLGKNDSTSSLHDRPEHPSSNAVPNMDLAQKPLRRRSSQLLPPKSPIITDHTLQTMQQSGDQHSLSDQVLSLPEQPVLREKKSSQFSNSDKPRGKKKYSQLDRTTDLIRNEKSLILDDIPRIVAAEQARELRPNAYRHRQKELSQEENLHVMDVHEKRQPEQYMSAMSANELFYVRHVAISLMQPSVAKWFTMDDLMELVETRKTSSLWHKFGKAFNLNGSADSKDKKKTGIFGVSLEQQIEKYGVESEFGVGPEKLKIPAFVDECISAMRQMDMSIEGIFRKNGNIRRSKELAEMADKTPGKTGMFTEENPIQLAALFKKYLRDLPDSLLTFKLQKLWLTSQEIDDIEERKRVMHLICCLLPSAHRDVMEVLFYFLYWTASFSHIDEESGSKMDIHNLSTVITPNILYPKRKEGAQDSSEGYFLAIEAVDILIKEHDRYAKVPHEVLEILSGTNIMTTCADSSSKEILNKIQQYIMEHDMPIPTSLMDEKQRLSTSSEPSADLLAKTNQLAVPTVISGRPGAVRAHTDNGGLLGNDTIKQVRSPAIS